MSKFTDRIKNVFTVDYDDYDEDYYDDYEDDDTDGESSRKDPGIGGMFAAFKSEFDKAAKGE